MPLTRRKAISAALGAGLTLASRKGFAQATASGPGRPNIVFIMADDLGFGDLGSYGRVYETPHIDSLARDGIKFTQAYANSCVCTATRVGLITGRYQNRFRVGLEEPLGFNAKSIGLDPATPTMPRYMRMLGYRTVLVGKWHMGDAPKFGPLKSGYDRFFGIYAGGADYFVTRNPTAANALNDGDRVIAEHRYLTDELGDRAIAEIEAAKRDGVPLFLSLHFTAPHWPWEGPEDRAVAEKLASIFDNSVGSIATFQKMLTSLDNNVGNVLAALERSGLADDTIVVFTSDNGGERYSNVWPLTGMKSELLEGGIRVPILARWPGRIRPGTTSEQVAISMDWMPTFLAAAGAPADFKAPTDGMNILPMLTGGADVERRLYWQFKANGQAAMRDGNWKFLRLAKHEYLFDLAADEHERANRAAAEPQRFARMKAQHAAWAATMLPYPRDSSSYSNEGNVPDRY